MKRDLKFFKEKIETNLQFSLNHMVWDSKNLKADKEIYDTDIDGFNNIEGFVKFPALVSLPYFDQGKSKKPLKNIF